MTRTKQTGRRGRGRGRGRGGRGTRGTIQAAQPQDQQEQLQEPDQQMIEESFQQSYAASTTTVDAASHTSFTTDHATDAAAATSSGLTVLERCLEGGHLYYLIRYPGREQVWHASTPAVDTPEEQAAFRAFELKQAQQVAEWQQHETFQLQGISEADIPTHIAILTLKHQNERRAKKMANNSNNPPPASVTATLPAASTTVPATTAASSSIASFVAADPSTATASTLSPAATSIVVEPITSTVAASTSAPPATSAPLVDLSSSQSDSKTAPVPGLKPQPQLPIQFDAATPASSPMVDEEVGDVDDDDDEEDENDFHMASSFDVDHDPMHAIQQQQLQRRDPPEEKSAIRTSPPPPSIVTMTEEDYKLMPPLSPMIKPSTTPNFINLISPPVLGATTTTLAASASTTTATAISSTNIAATVSSCNICASASPPGWCNTTLSRDDAATILTCYTCQITVHAACYGVAILPLVGSHWWCAVCDRSGWQRHELPGGVASVENVAREEERLAAKRRGKAELEKWEEDIKPEQQHFFDARKVRCLICAQKGGPLIPIQFEFNYIHVLCALHLPTSFLTKWPPAPIRWFYMQKQLTTRDTSFGGKAGHVICKLCQIQRFTYCTGCAEPGCDVRLHPTCAREYGCKFVDKPPTKPGQIWQHIVFCPRHSKDGNEIASEEEDEQPKMKKQKRGRAAKLTSAATAKSSSHQMKSESIEIGDERKMKEEKQEYELKESRMNDEDDDVPLSKMLSSNGSGGSRKRKHIPEFDDSKVESMDETADEDVIIVSLKKNKSPSITTATTSSSAATTSSVSRKRKHLPSSSEEEEEEEEKVSKPTKSSAKLKSKKSPSKLRKVTASEKVKPIDDSSSSASISSSSTDSDDSSGSDSSSSLDDSDTDLSTDRSHTSDEDDSDDDARFLEEMDRRLKQNENGIKKNKEKLKKQEAATGMTQFQRDQAIYLSRQEMKKKLDPSTPKDLKIDRSWTTGPGSESVVMILNETQLNYSTFCEAMRLAKTLQQKLLMVYLIFGNLHGKHKRPSNLPNITKPQRAVFWYEAQRDLTRQPSVIQTLIDWIQDAPFFLQDLSYKVADKSVSAAAAVYLDLVASILQGLSNSYRLWTYLTISMPQRILDGLSPYSNLPLEQVKQLTALHQQQEKNMVTMLDRCLSGPCRGIPWMTKFITTLKHRLELSSAGDLDLIQKKAIEDAVNPRARTTDESKQSSDPVSSSRSEPASTITESPRTFSELEAAIQKTYEEPPSRLTLHKRERWQKDKAKEREDLFRQLTPAQRQKIEEERSNMKSPPPSTIPYSSLMFYRPPPPEPTFSKPSARRTWKATQRAQEVKYRLTLLKPQVEIWTREKDAWKETRPEVAAELMRQAERLKQQLPKELLPDTFQPASVAATAKAAASTYASQLATTTSNNSLTTASTTVPIPPKSKTPFTAPSSSASSRPTSTSNATASSLHRLPAPNSVIPSVATPSALSLAFPRDFPSVSPPVNYSISPPSFTQAESGGNLYIPASSLIAPTPSSLDSSLHPPTQFDVNPYRMQPSSHPSTSFTTSGLFTYDTMGAYGASHPPPPSYTSSLHPGGSILPDDPYDLSFQQPLGFGDHGSSGSGSGSGSWQPSPGMGMNYLGGSGAGSAPIDFDDDMPPLER